MNGPVINRIRWFAHELLEITGAMWVTSVVLLWVLDDTNALAVASRHMPANPDGIGHQALVAGDAAQILAMFTVMLPVLIILLIVAGALHRPARRTER